MNELNPLVGVRRAAVVGLGITGAAVADALLDLGIEVRVCDAGDSSVLRERAGDLTAKGAEVVLGREPVELADWAEVIVPSKGVPPSNPVLRAALDSGTRVLSEFELACRWGNPRFIAVTGTNGKTTTTHLIEEMLAASGISAVSAGNLPTPLIEAVRAEGGEGLFVCEASSFGLRFIEDFHPEVAVVLNVADDHYDWHTGYEDYVAAKARITENQSASDLLAVLAGDQGCARIAAGSRARLAAFGTGTPDEVRDRLAAAIDRKAEIVGGVSGGSLVVESEGSPQAIVPVADIRMQGGHNVENVLAASIAALASGADVGAVGEVARSFESLPHRMAVVREVSGVIYVDDSKATNPHAVLRALSGAENVILIAGGQDRGIDLKPLRSVAGALSGAVVMGETAERLADIFGSAGVPVVRAADMDEAVGQASDMARSGDTVLLSPGCASFDQYSSYAERGERFAEAVVSL